MALPLISVSLCTHNRRVQLAKTLASLEKQTTEDAFSYEVIVIDDGSTDDTQEFLAGFSKQTSMPFRYVRENGAGVGQARNRGVTESRGEWIAFIDDDEMAEPDWLLRLAETAFPHDADCVGAPILVESPKDSLITPVGTVLKLLGESPVMKRTYGEETRKDKVPIYNLPSTGNALVKRSVFDDIGMFNPSLSVGEDMDFFRRARKAGCNIFRAPNAVVYHILPPERFTPDYLIPLAVHSGKTQAYFDRKEWGHFGTIRSSILRFVHAVVVTVPLLGIALIRRDKSWRLSRRCSLYFMRSYILKTISMFVSKKSTQEI